MSLFSTPTKVCITVHLHVGIVPRELASTHYLGELSSSDTWTNEVLLSERPQGRRCWTDHFALASINSSRGTGSFAIRRKSESETCMFYVFFSFSSFFLFHLPLMTIKHKQEWTMDHPRCWSKTERSSVRMFVAMIRYFLASFIQHRHRVLLWDKLFCVVEHGSFAMIERV